MEIKKTAISGTLESSDIQITISNNESGINIDLTSNVEKQFGRQIRSLILESLNEFSITNANVKAVDKGALDCTIKARMKDACIKALGEEDEA